MRGMDLDQPDAQAHDLVHVRLHIGAVPRMHAAARNQPLGVFFAVLGHPLVNLGGEPHDLRRNVIDKDGALHSHGIQILEQRLGRPAVFKDVFKVAARLLHDLNGPGLEHFIRLYVDVAVSDQHSLQRPDPAKREREPYRLQECLSIQKWVFGHWYLVLGQNFDHQIGKPSTKYQIPTALLTSPSSAPSWYIP